MVKFQSTLEINKEVVIPLKYTKPVTLFENPLTTKQQVYSNYLWPNLFTSLLFILNFAADFCLAFQHHRDENNIEASLTLLLIYVPTIGSIFFTLSDYDLWPDRFGFGCKNFKWLMVKILEHLFFPVWAMYRFAEQLFWSIEGLRCNEDEIEEILLKSERNSVFELYHFLQAYTQAAPQILFQLHIIFRQTSRFNEDTVYMQMFSVIISLMKMSLTTTSYQRFKSQKAAGRKYPWKKEPIVHLHTIQETYKMVRSRSEEAASKEDINQAKSNIIEPEKDDENENSEIENSDTEADRYNDILPVPLSRKSSGLSDTSSVFNEKMRLKEETDTILPAPLSRKSSDLSITSSVFNEKMRSKEETNPAAKIMIPKTLITYRGLPEDDAAGKLVSFLWWLCFILPRMFTLSAFAYFYPNEIFWICGFHYFITLAFLLYDAHTSNIQYYRALFILFTAYIYMFCLIEFKVKFKKVKFIYNGYFFLVYIENFIMNTIWYVNIGFDDYWWYKYVFNVIVCSSIFSCLSMFLYLFVLKPKKITVHQEYRNSKVL